MLDVGIPIMSERMVQALLSAGVNNVEFHEAVLINTVTGEKYPYRAFNVVGLVAAANLDRSECDIHDGVPVADVSFYKLVLDESKCRSCLMFRLEENVSTLMVHDSVRQELLSRGIDMLKFIKPEDYVQI